VDNIDLSPGETVTCTFINTKRGRIFVDKATLPAGVSQRFSFALTGGPSALEQSFSLTDASPPHDSGDVLPGASYSAAETVPAGWDLTSATCSDGSPVDNIDLSPGETVTCTFANTKRGRILVDKVTDPAGESQGFDFALSGGASALAQSFSLTDASPPHDSGDLLPGAGYGAAETVPAGWDLTSATCSDGSPVDNIDLSPGETVTCTFTNTKRAGLTIQKQDDDNPANLLPGATFTLWIDSDPGDGDSAHDPAEDIQTDLSCTTDATGECTIIYVPLGNYWVVESFTPSEHDTARDQYVSPGSGAEVTLCFVDRRQYTTIVLVCSEADNQLYASDVTIDGVTKKSLDTGGGGAITDSELCALLGARYENMGAGNHQAEARISDVVESDNCSDVVGHGDNDPDRDGVPSSVDVCPSHFDPGQVDSDGDGSGDTCDNCVSTFNPAQVDFDSDGVGDRCDLNDGMIYLLFTDKSRIQWQPESGFDGWNFYKGDLNVLRSSCASSTCEYTQALEFNSLAEQDCDLTSPAETDASIPAVGEVAYYLVAGVAGGVEGDLGKNSLGSARVNPNPCQ
jgi:hypothetical protein